MKDFERKLLDEFQRDLPLVAEPFAEMGEALGVDADTVMESLTRLTEDGTVSRVGAVIRPGAVGESTLCAMAVPLGRLEEIAALVSGFDAVNHNYEREHRLNLWFVVTGADREGVDRVIAEIESRTGLEVLDLPMEESYRLDLGFTLQWS